jgi:hypothetical protein
VNWHFGYGLHSRPQASGTAMSMELSGKVTSPALHAVSARTTEASPVMAQTADRPECGRPGEPRQRTAKGAQVRNAAPASPRNPTWSDGRAHRATSVASRAVKQRRHRARRDADPGQRRQDRRQDVADQWQDVIVWASRRVPVRARSLGTDDQVRQWRRIVNISSISRAGCAGQSATLPPRPERQ